ncbi:hypothetical protein GOV07_05655 [Candidatus Woesearchaeota archaeon]|nr:hypothetical protein [Candidatus Woesearchaeota archaeon]
MATIVIFAAHNDDHALGMGATIAKHYKDKDNVYTFIGSFGEMSHPHFKPEIIRKTRVKEAQRADRIYGGNGQVQFLGLRELKFEEDFKRKKLDKQLQKRLNKLKPSKIYMPGENDSHPDHKAITKLALGVLDKTKLKPDVYAYYVYPNLQHPKTAKLIVNVSDTYRKKTEGIRAFKSQIHFFTHAFTNNIVYLYALARNSFNGFMHGTRWAETFYKLR